MKNREVLDIIFNDLCLCGCGRPEDILRYITEALRAYREVLDTDWSEEARKKAELFTDGILREWTAHIMDSAGLLDHGTGIHGAWITDKGREFLLALEKYAPEKWLDPMFDAGDEA